MAVNQRSGKKKIVESKKDEIEPILERVRDSELDRRAEILS